MSTIILVLQLDKGMMGFDPLYFYIAMGGYIYGCIFTALLLHDSFSDIIARHLLSSRTAKWFRNLVIVMPDCISFTAWMISTTSLVTIMYVSTHHRMCYSGRQQTDGYENCREALGFMIMSIWENFLFTCTLCASVSKACRTDEESELVSKKAASV